MTSSIHAAKKVKNDQKPKSRGSPALINLDIANGGLARHAVALKIEKPGAKGCLGGIASAGWLEDHHIQSFSREKVFELCKKNAPVIEVLAMETLPRDSASPEDCSHVDALQV